MSQSERFENVILGGEAGKHLGKLVGGGQRTAVIERALIGGSCPNVACLPSKNVIHRVRVASLVHGAARFGVRPALVGVPPGAPADAQLAAWGPSMRLPQLEEAGHVVVAGVLRCTREAVPA